MTIVNCEICYKGFTEHNKDSREILIAAMIDLRCQVVVNSEL